MSNILSQKMARLVFLLPILFYANIHQSFGQFLWPQDTSGSISLEIFKPQFNTNNENFNIGRLDINLPTTANYLTFRLPFSKSKNSSFILEVPIIHQNISTDVQGVSLKDSKTTLGNLYVGFEFGKGRRSISWGEVGVRIPTIGEDDGFLVSDFTIPITVAADPMRYESGLPSTTGLSLSWNLRGNLGTAGFIKFRLGSTLLVLDNTFANDPDVLIDYTITGGHTIGLANVMLGLSGRHLANKDGGSFNALSLPFHQIGVSSSFNLGKLQPGLSFKLPIGSSLKSITNYTFGLNLSYTFG